jgi:integrase
VKPKRTSSLNLRIAQNLTLLIDGDGVINAPMSIYLNEEYDNPNTKDLVSVPLRVLHRFLMVHGIDLPSRALEGECLKAVECKWLAELAYRPLEEIEQMSDEMLKRFNTTSRKTNAMDLKGALEPNTVAKRLNRMAHFLKRYREGILDESIRSAALKAQIKDRYTVVCMQLENRIRGTKQGHHHNIRSLPIERYKQVIRELVVNAETLFCTESGKPSATMMRDRAISLLAAEGLRPGAIGNLTVDDFRYRAGDLTGYMVIKDNVARRGTTVTSAVPTVKGIRSTKQPHNSNITVSLWPFTCQAIKDYLDGERDAVLGRRLANRSKSFLFVAEHGRPIGDRTTLSAVFSSLGYRLKALGFLNVAEGDPYATGKHYKFTAYTLRHSAATLFYKTHAKNKNVLDLMRERFGWTARSTAPSRYAKRSMSEAASVDMQEFHETLLQALAVKRQERQKRLAHDDQNKEKA